MPRRHTLYSPGLRSEAVRLARYGEISIPQIARDLRISDQTLRNGVAQADIDEGRAEGLTSTEREELRRLRKEVRVLREERATPEVVSDLLRPGDRSPEVTFRLIEAKKSRHAISLLCMVSDLSRSDQYAWSGHLLREGRLPTRSDRNDLGS